MEKRRKFIREFKVEAVKLVRERGVSVRLATSVDACGRDLSPVISSKNG